jgi:recombination protein RecT
MANVQLYTANDEGQVIQKLFKANLEAIKKQAPRFIADPGRLIRIAYNSIVYNDDLRKCTQITLVGGVLEALKLGITLGGPMQEGWLLPFRNTRKGTMDATLIVGYMGYRNIIDRAGAVIDLHPRAVYQGCEFDVTYTEEGPRLRHRPYYMTGKTQGALTHVYATARLKGGGRQVEVLPKAEVDKHRARSRAKDSGPWVTDYDAMALKTSIRVIAKYLPKSSELLSRALDLDEKADLGQEQDFEVENIEVFDDSKPKQVGTGAPSALDRLKQNLAGGDAPELRDEPPDNATLDKEIADREK